jgi:hypothetical protein
MCTTRRGEAVGAVVPDQDHSSSVRFRNDQKVRSGTGINHSGTTTLHEVSACKQINSMMEVSSRNLLADSSNSLLVDSSNSLLTDSSKSPLVLPADSSSGLVADCSSYRNNDC